jgi:ureidoacrylate peracid hydrolase
VRRPRLRIAMLNCGRGAVWISERGQDLDLPVLVDPNRTALIVIDVQNDFCHPNGAFGSVGFDHATMPKLAATLHRLLAAARERQVLTIFVRATYDQEVTSRPLAQHRRRLGLLQSLCLEGSWGADWFAGVVPAGAPNEVVLTKHRFDAFQGTPLDLYLRNNGITTVIVTGVVTSGCVESTVRDAFFLDYRVVVPSDGVAESFPGAHERGLAVMGRSFAAVTEADAIIAAWRQSNAPVAPLWRPEQRCQRAADANAAECLVVVDAAALDGGEAAACSALKAAALDAGIPIFDVRSVAVPAGQSVWDASQPADVMPAGFGAGTLGASSPAEMKIGKLRRSAFADTRLGLLLRTNEIRHVTVAGADAVAGSLAATVLDALDADYAVTVIADACQGDLPANLVGSATLPSAEIMARWRVRRPGAGRIAF